MLRILTYNVHRWLGTDRRISPERTAEVIAACQPDIVALQEVRAGRARHGSLDLIAAVARRLGMDLHFQPTIRMFGDEFGLAVLTNCPSRLVKAGPLRTLSRGPALESRCAMWVAVEVGDGELHVVNTHLALLSGRERLAQADALLSYEWLRHPRRTGPAVLVGDLNTGPRSRTYRRFAEDLRDVHVDAPTAARHATFHTRLPMRRIDHVFVSPDIGVLGAEAVRSPLARFASDHLPLVADLALPFADGTARPHPPERPALPARSRLLSRFARAS